MWLWLWLWWAEDRWTKYWLHVALWSELGVVRHACWGGLLCGEVCCRHEWSDLDWV